LNIEDILNLPPPSTLFQLQSLQWKENFLCRFIPKYMELTKGFIRLLMKGVPFVWDDTAQTTFDALKHTLTNTPLLHPSGYSRDYFLYIVASNSTIAMVFVQEDDSNDEHVVYYLNKSLSHNEIKYSHVDKLALVVVHNVQCFHHYILLHKTTIIFYCNPMQNILTRQVLGGKYSKWIVILQDFDLEFEKSNSKKSFVFVDIICDLPSYESESLTEELSLDESLFSNQLF